MRAHSGAMTQINASKCLLHTLLPILLLVNSWASAGFISPGNSVSVGRSPTLRYLLACAHLAAKPPFFSTHDVYTNDQVSRSSCVYICVCIRKCICIWHPNQKLHIYRWPKDCATCRLLWVFQRQGWRASRRGG